MAMRMAVVSENNSHVLAWACGKMLQEKKWSFKTGSASVTVRDLCSWDSAMKIPVFVKVANVRCGSLHVHLSGQSSVNIIFNAHLLLFKKKNWLICWGN